MDKKMDKRMVVVTTELKGVFFGELVESDTDKVILKDAQMCVYWDAKTRGVLGLASHGPADGSKVTAVIPKIELVKVTAIMDCTEEAVREWEKEKWD